MGRSDNSWFKTLAGNAILGISGGLALFMAVILFMGKKAAPWWVAVAGLAVAGLLALWGDNIRTHRIKVDPDTGKVKKNQL